MNKYGPEGLRILGELQKARARVFLNTDHMSVTSRNQRLLWESKFRSWYLCFQKLNISTKEKTHQVRSARRAQRGGGTVVQPALGPDGVRRVGI